MRYFNLQNLILSTMSCLLTVLACQTAVGQTTGKELPSGEEVMTRHIEASGGQAAFDRIDNRFFKSTIEITNAGIVLNASTWAAKPNKLISVIEAEAIGKIKKGCTGEAVWSLSDMQGPVVEQGVSLENQLRDATLDRLVYWKKAYQSANCEAIEKVNDKDCYRVVLVPHPYQDEEFKDADMTSTTVYFDTTTFLVSQIDSNVVTDAGNIQVTAFMSNYQTVDGIQVAYRIELHLAGQKRVVELQSVEHNLDLSDDHFDPPAEIQKLLDKAAAGK